MVNDAADEIDRLRAEKKEFDEQYRQIINDRTPVEHSAEVHCTCVPWLRSEIDRLRQELGLREAQIEGMTIRIHDAEKLVADLEGELKKSKERGDRLFNWKQAIIVALRNYEAKLTKVIDGGDK
jgi:chromosome segregation ATPase